MDRKALQTIVGHCLLAMSYRQAELKVQEQLLVLQQTRNVLPANSGIDSLNLILLLSWLLACPLMSETLFRRGRFLVFIGIVSSSIWNLFHVRSIGVIGSIGIGMNSVLFTVVALNFVLLHDPRTSRRLAMQVASRTVKATEKVDVKQNSHAVDRQYSIPLAWEPIPDSTPRRLWWALDLISSMRAVHWSWKPSPTPSYPQSLRVARSSRTAALSRSLSRFLRDYLLIDLVQCMMISDPYFLGETTYGVPPHLSEYIKSPSVLYTYRWLLGLAGGFLAMDLQYSSAVLMQVNILGPGVLGFNAYPSTFRPLWGSPNAVLQKGLRGFWGETWHQMLRVHFASVGDAIADAILRDGGRKSAKSSSARLWIRVVVVFLLSGILHACASYTLLGPTRPWRSFAFFAIQPVGIAAQSICSQLFTASGGKKMLGSWNGPVYQASNLVFTIWWFWMLSDLLLEDLSSGGMWMFEPVPISPLRSLGFSQDKRIWCW